MMWTLALVFVGSTIGNFAYQAFSGMDWSAAAERSFFQAAVLLAAGISLHGNG